MSEYEYSIDYEQLKHGLWYPVRRDGFTSAAAAAAYLQEPFVNPDEVRNGTVLRRLVSPWENVDGVRQITIGIIRQLQEQGLSVEEIAESWGISADDVRRKIEQYQ
ncbi:hypothetical protein D2E42_24465 [Mycobacteroides abscessus]|uniref:hypothetical protein n=1 Tax=Mycobacteroides abscessus TaxID=36809 RepID=UPI000D3E1565|nr:hypothetical protein [Mycobacteroides abscessus]PVB46379.1 hypothetical protein DDK10_24570 [Mycobacteroides abscessus]RIR66436.1 hypothetical protein D2E42_24465 [Mycobacteroides abscessus]